MHSCKIYLQTIDSFTLNTLAWEERTKTKENDESNSLNN